MAAAPFLVADMKKASWSFDHEASEA